MIPHPLPITVRTLCRVTRHPPEIAHAPNNKPRPDNRDQHRRGIQVPIHVLTVLARLVNISNRPAAVAGHGRLCEMRSLLSRAICTVPRILSAIAFPPFV